MLRIDRLRMQLPAGFKHRASSIARLVGESMAGIHPSQNRTLDRLSIGPIQVSPNSTDQDIAHSVTERIASTLRREL